MISDEALLDAVEVARAKIALREGEMRRVEELVVGAQREFGLLVELARLRGLIDTQTALDGASIKDIGGTDEWRRTISSDPTRSSAPNRDALLRVVDEVLRQHGKPMPIRKLMAEVVSRAAPIPGRGNQANLISVLTRAPEITRPARGVYGLAEWGKGAAPRARRTVKRPARVTRKTRL